MSDTILFTVPEKGAIQKYREFQNSHLWGRMCWEYIGRKYLNLEPVDVLLKADQIWPLFESDKLTTYERIALGSTYDNVMVKREDLPRLVEAFGKFGIISGNIRWSEMAGAVKSLIDAELDFVAVCWTVTTITDAWWVYEPDKDDSRMYDLSRDNKHWFLFDRLQ